MSRHTVFSGAALGAAWFALALSCSDDPLGSDCTPNESVACACTDGTLSTQVCNADGNGFAQCECHGSSSGGVSSGGADVPCDVASVLSQSCWECHGETTRFGAIMPLTTAAHFRAPSSVPDTSVGERVLFRVTDDEKPMPQPPKRRLTAAEIETLEAWISRGSPAESCPPPGSVNPGPSQPNPSPTGTGTSSPNPDPTGTGTGEPPPPPPPDPTVQCYELRAHAPGSTAPYSVPNTPDLYQCFTFNRPWGDKEIHMVSSRPIIDNDRVIHHWILYNNNGGVPDGGSGACSGAHPDAQFIAGWAPGGEAAELPPDVGQVVPGQGFTLEIHYNNTLGAQADASGVEICVTDQLRPNAAAIHWLGTESIRLPAGGTVNGTCRPNNTGPVTILSSSPHMHLQGRHMRTVINRAGGGTDVLIDEPFSFESQVTYPTPTVIQPGDTLTTTCTYGGPAYFGSGTNEEMCYNFVLAYPAGQLAQGSSLLRQNNCTGL